jgi:hypothetical protein
VIIELVNLSPVVLFLAAPRVSDITEDGCLVEWSTVKLAPVQGPLHFKVQLSKVKDNGTKIVSLASIKNILVIF